jgi:hypothetical protein
MVSVIPDVPASVNLIGAITPSTSSRNYYCLRDHELASGSSKRAFVTPNPDLASRYDPTDSKAPGSAR